MPPVNRSDQKAEVEYSVGSILTNALDGTLERTGDFGSLFCSVENHDDVGIVRRQFQTEGEALNIPFSNSIPGIQMIFSLNGRSVLNNRSNPFVLTPQRHSLNLFNEYDCRNILDERTRQDDVVFRLKRSFYSEIITNHLSVSEDRLPAMIFHHREFNTLNEHLPVDAAITGILQNIFDCPFKGPMKTAFIREHIRALLTLQLFHFSPIITRTKIRRDNKINLRDEDILREIKKYIDENFLDETSLERLTRQFGINEFKLKHGFKTLFDTSPIRYLQYKRLEFSLALLRDTDMTIKAIADKIGYSHATNFTNAFTKAFGSSPLHYRPSYRRFVSDAFEELSDDEFDGVKVC